MSSVRAPSGADRARGPIAALLILLSLFLGSGPAAAGGAELRGTAARLSPNRSGAASAVILPGGRTLLDEEAAAGAEGGSFLPPPPPLVVTNSRWARPLDSPGGGSTSLPPQQAKAAYRARAPPAP